MRSVGPQEGENAFENRNDTWGKNSESIIVDEIPIPSNTGYQAYANPISSGVIEAQVGNGDNSQTWSNPSPYPSSMSAPNAPLCSAPIAPLSYTPQIANYPMATLVHEPTNAGAALNEDDQMREALKLSLAEYDPKGSINHTSTIVASSSFTGLSKEDEEMARAIEQSIAAANPKSEDEPLNPHNRKRQPGMGVGLKNIGNTCYVNSLLQTYFAIPELREAIMTWDFSPWMDNPAAAESCGGGVALVAALQQLFAEMTLSNRRCASSTSRAKQTCRPYLCGIGCAYFRTGTGCAHCFGRACLGTGE